MRHSIAIFDPSLPRRTMLTRAITHFCHVEPYETEHELRAAPPRKLQLVLVSDEAGELATVRAILHEFGIPIPMIGYANAPRTQAIVAALNAGCFDYFDIPRDLETVMTRIDQAIEIAPEVVADLRRTLAAKEHIGRLSERELSVGVAVARGRTNKEIARELGLSPRTVEVHRANMVRKLEVATTTDLIRILVDCGMVS
jgi:DNA-binding NarL/FixJ family response regulator